MKSGNQWRKVDFECPGRFKILLFGASGGYNNLCNNCFGASKNVALKTIQNNASSP